MKHSARNASEDDRLWLDQLRREVYHDLFLATWGAWDEERHNRHFLSSWEMGNIKIIELDGKPVGMLQVFDLEKQIEIEEIQIAPIYQRQGLATAIIKDILTDAQKRDKKVALSTGLKNLGALKLYKKLGFIETRRTDSKVYLDK